MAAEALRRAGYGAASALSTGVEQEEPSEKISTRGAGRREINHEDQEVDAGGISYAN